LKALKWVVILAAIGCGAIASVLWWSQFVSRVEGAATVAVPAPGLAIVLASPYFSTPPLFNFSTFVRDIWYHPHHSERPNSH